MRIQALFVIRAFFAIGPLLITVQAAAQTAGPPCRPCAGVIVDDPAAIAAQLHQDPRLEGEARLYVAWPAELDGTAAAGRFEAVRAYGATPWAVVTFRTPQPVRQHLDALENELRELARLSRGAGEQAHIQVIWEPSAGTGDGVDLNAEDHGYLLKRAAVVVTGARADARFLAGPLPSDGDYLTALYAEEVAAYLDGVVLAPGAGLDAARETLAELDPGKPVALYAEPWPAESSRTLARAAEAAASGIAVTFFDVDSPATADLGPLKILAREFQGDLSYDAATTPSGAAGAWAFVRGEDLSLRVIAEAGAGQQKLDLFFDDTQLRGPRLLDLATGEESIVFDQRRTETGLAVPLEEGVGPVALLSVRRMTAAELEGIDERLEVADRRQMPVEEILRRLQAFEDDQARKLERYQAHNILHLRFLLGNGAASIEAAYEGAFFYERGAGFDWAWETFFVDGVKWRGKKLPELPLIQPEKAAALPIEIYLEKEYSYRLRGTAVVDGRDCWVVDFKPVEVVPGRNLHQGTVWIDREIYARVRTRAVQLGLEGDVISNEETTTFTSLDDNGRPAPWSRDSYVLPTRVVGQQLFSILNATVPVETETQLSEIRINAGDFQANREAVRESELTMVRDTDQGLRYLRKDESGQRVVETDPDTGQRFLVGGVFWDESVDFPIPLAGINWLDLDWRDSGNQVNLFFAGPLLTANLAEPRLFGSKWDAGVNVFGFFIPRGDELYRDGRAVPFEEIESTTASVGLFVGRPLGSFAKLDFTYRARFDAYSDADDTAEDFVIPNDTLTHTFQSELQYNRSGYRVELQGSFSQRDDWEFWGLPGNLEFDPEQEDYVRWQATFAKTFWLPKFRKFGFEIEHLNGSDLDRFSRYDFGIFGDSSVAGYQGGLVRADEATGIHLNYGVNVAELLRFEIEGDAVWATSDETGLDNELLAGIGLEGTLALPWQLLTNFEIGLALDGPGEGGVAARIVFLKLFKKKFKSK